jgi:hypothetical protein
MSEPKPDPVSLADLLKRSHLWGGTGREMARRLRALSERHQPKARWYGRDKVCFCGYPWPCPDSVILNGGVPRG